MNSFPSFSMDRRRIGIIVAVVAAFGLIYYAVPVLTKKSEQSYICTKKTGKKPPKHVINITFIEQGKFSKTCVSSRKKKQVMKTDCGKPMARLIEKGFTCKRTRLDLN